MKSTKYIFILPYCRHTNVTQNCAELQNIYFILFCFISCHCTFVLLLFILYFKMKRSIDLFFYASFCLLFSICFCFNSFFCYCINNFLNNWLFFDNNFSVFNSCCNIFFSFSSFTNSIS